MAAAANPNFKMVGKRGDLFSCPAKESLVHCVSSDMHMSKGIAKSFKDTFGGIDELIAQDKQVGDVAVLKNGNRYIYYLIMKERRFDKPTYETLRSSLAAMREHCLKYKVTNLSMPQIGCGLNRLQWSKVSEVINEVFKNCDMTITVYQL